MIQYSNKNYQPTESHKDFGRFAISTSIWARTLGTGRVEEENQRQRT